MNYKKNRSTDFCILILSLFCSCYLQSGDKNDRKDLTALYLLGSAVANGSQGFHSARLEIMSEIQFPFYAPYSLAIDNADNVYVSESADYSDTFGLYLYNFNEYPTDPGNVGNRIRKFDSSGNYIGWIGMNTNGVSGFHSSTEPDTVLNGTQGGRFQKIRGMKFDSDGTLYVIDRNRIHRFAPNTHSFAGWAGHVCKTATCQNAEILYAQKVAEEGQISIDCEASLDWSQTDGEIEADFQNCLDTSGIAAVSLQKGNAKDTIIANVSSGWNTNESFNQWGLYSASRLDSVEQASGLTIHNGKLWIGSFQGIFDTIFVTLWGFDSQPGTRINVFDQTTGRSEGWLGGAKTGGQTSTGFFPASSLASGTRPLGTGYHTNSPGLFNAPRSMAWHEDLLYVADNTSDPVVSVFNSEGKIVKSQYHDSGAKPFAITVAPNGLILTSNMYTGEIEIYDPDFRKIGVWRLERPSVPNRWYPIAAADFAWDSQGFLYISATTLNKVFKTRLIAE